MLYDFSRVSLRSLYFPPRVITIEINDRGRERGRERQDRSTAEAMFALKYRGENDRLGCRLLTIEKRQPEPTGRIV